MAALDPNFEQWLEDKIQNLKDRGVIVPPDEDQPEVRGQELHNMSNMSASQPAEVDLGSGSSAAHRQGDYYQFVFEDEDQYEDDVFDAEQEFGLRGGGYQEGEQGRVEFLSENGVHYQSKEEMGFDDDWELEVDTSHPSLDGPSYKDNSEDEEERFYNELRGKGDGDSYENNRNSFSEIAYRGTVRELNLDPGVMSDDDIIGEIEREVSRDHTPEVPDIGFRGQSRIPEITQQPSPTHRGRILLPMDNLEMSMSESDDEEDVLPTDDDAMLDDVDIHEADVVHSDTRPIVTIDEATLRQKWAMKSRRVKVALISISLVLGFLIFGLVTYFVVKALQDAV